MYDHFPFRPEPDWYADLVRVYGDQVPSLDKLVFRFGLQRHVRSLLDDMADLGFFAKATIKSIITTAAGRVDIDINYSADATEADQRLTRMLVDRYRERLSSVCEHCGDDQNTSVTEGRLLCNSCKGWTA